ncbi:MAG: ribonuclease HII [Verrucomicrobiota bacterium]
MGVNPVAKVEMNALQRHDHALLEAECRQLIGIDEAGRGALAGPVMAGACVISKAIFSNVGFLERCQAINDSKQLSAEAREAQYTILVELRKAGQLDFEVAAASVQEIETLNILGATRLAMRRAVEALAERAPSGELPLLAANGPLFQAGAAIKLIVDGRPLRPFPYVHEGIVKGDGKSLAIAMASIAAKVTRDRAMSEFALRYPAYGFARHKGYGTAAHRSAIKQSGATPIHRALFLRKLLAK